MEPLATADPLYLAFIAGLLLIDHFVLWPAFLRKSQADPGRARRLLWTVWILILWTLVAIGVALWFAEARPWSALRLVSPHGWRLWLAAGLVLAVTIGCAQPVLRIARSKRTKRVKMAPGVERLAPHTRTELAWWMALSLSAGFGEEFVFRGYLIWLFQPFIGLLGAAALSLVMFALAHAYQGARGIVATGVVGALLTLVVLVTGSLWPAIVLHAIIDIGQGLLAWAALRGVPTEIIIEHQVGGALKS